MLRSFEVSCGRAKSERYLGSLTLLDSSLSDSELTQWLVDRLEVSSDILSISIRVGMKHDGVNDDNGMESPSAVG